MKIATYNVNGIRAAMGKGLAEWIEAAGPDVLCLQETKAQPDQIPVFEFSTLGYETAEWPYSPAVIPTRWWKASATRCTTARDVFYVPTTAMLAL